MIATSGIGLRDVQAVYGGPEGDLWELLMGEQIHIGGLTSTMDLADRAGIGAGMSGVDFCCCTGAGMRALLRFRDVARMTGVDATERVIERGRRRIAEQGLGNRITFVHADACESGLPSDSVDFVWGEDAWCYVVDKARLIAEAARIVRPGGTIAFTDWVEGPAGLSPLEALRFLAFMKFPNVATLGDYRDLLAMNGCEVLSVEDTGRFAPYIDLYLEMVSKQLTFDVLRILSFDRVMLKAMGGEMKLMRELAEADKIAQGLFIARKR